VKLIFQEFVYVKEDIEKQIEDLVKKILEKDDGANKSTSQLFNSQTSKFSTLII